MKKIVPLLLSCLVLLAPGVQAATAHSAQCKSSQSYNPATGMCVSKSDIGLAGG